MSSNGFLIIYYSLIHVDFEKNTSVLIFGLQLVIITQMSGSLLVSLHNVVKNKTVRTLVVDREVRVPGRAFVLCSVEQEDALLSQSLTPNRRKLTGNPVEMLVVNLR